MWEGDIDAALIRYEQNPRLRGNPTPQSADVIIRRRADRTEHTCFLGGTESLPWSVRQQVYTSATIINEHRPNFAVPSEEKQQAFEYAKNGGYRSNFRNLQLCRSKKTSVAICIGQHCGNAAILGCPPRVYNSFCAKPGRTASHR